jgi:Serpin (serine protease inhibitor)
MTQTAQLAAAVARYAERLHAAAGTGHHVASPLGAWLVLALVAPASTGEPRARLEDALGMPAEAAASAAARLLEDPHPVVAAAAAVWYRERVVTDALRDWLVALPSSVEHDDVPDQAGADAWADRHTHGLIRTFPIRITPEVMLVLASALASKVTWRRAFDIAPAAQLGDSPWATAVESVLRSPESGHEAYIASTARGGTVAVHTARDETGLAVTSVVAADGVSVADTLAAAHEAATGDAPRTSLFDLPLGDAPLWSISEASSTRGGREERCAAVLPAWSARSDHDLGGVPGLGFDDAAEALVALLPPGRWEHEARQAAYARYSREGFEAAAVTAIGMRLAAVRSGDGVVRIGVLRFPHPYAVVASVEADGSPWDGLPVFSAWVAKPENPD